MSLSLENLHEFQKIIPTKRILVIGDLILDVFVHGTVDRLSPEAPIPILNKNASNYSLGGAGNVAKNIAALGGKCHLISVCGDDASGLKLQKILSDIKGVETSLIVTDRRPTIEKTRYLTAAQQILRVDSEVTEAIDKASEKNIMNVLLGELPKSDAVILSDYGKGVLQENLIQYIIGLAEDKNIPVFVDPKGNNYSIYRGADFVTPNRLELSAATNITFTKGAGDNIAKQRGEDEKVIKAAKKLQTDCGIKAVLATRSEQGMSLISKDEIHHIPTQAQDVFDVAGAGDTVIAAFALAISCCKPVKQAAIFANMAAGIVVGKLGTASVNFNELMAVALPPHEIAGIVNFSDEGAGDIIAGIIVQWRGTTPNGKVGFTNGCFDILHAGHIKLLKEARDKCDFLIVGMNSDASVKGLKGLTRPIQGEDNRAIILSALKMVDLVVIFADPTPLTLIKVIAPNLLIKGGDYKIADIVGADEVQRQGGEVVIVDYLENHSTSGIIERMVKT